MHLIFLRLVPLYTEKTRKANYFGSKMHQKQENIGKLMVQKGTSKGKEGKNMWKPGVILLKNCQIPILYRGKSWHEICNI